MSGAIEEVGARMILQNGPKFRADLAASTTALKAFNDEQVRAAQLSKTTSSALIGAATAGATAAKASAATVKESLAGQTEAQDATVVAYEAAQKKMVAVQAKYDGTMLAASKASMKSAVTASTKVLKIASVGALGAGYESLKNYMSFQQMIAQSAIDAGVKASQLPAFSKMAIQLSNYSGLAAAGTNGVADAMYRIASAYPGMHLTVKEMGNIAKQAVNVAVAFGQTGNLDSLSRAYGAIMSQDVRLTGGPSGKKPSPAQISQWALAVAGHGDVKGGDLIAALGTGILAQIATNHVSLNSAGAAFDVLAPAMNAQQASTRLSHAIAMIANPNGPSRTLYAMAGMNPLSVAGAIKTGDLGGGLAALNKFLNTGLSGANYSSATYGSGTAGVKAYLTQGLHFTSAQAAQAVQGGFAAITPGPGQAKGLGVSAALNAMFGGARFGSTVEQVLSSYNSGEFQTKQAQIKASENPKSYAAALKIAFNEPIVQVHKFEQQLKNLSIRIGSDVSPVFDAFLGDLEKMGKWFGNNEWALKALAGGAGTIVAGAALLKGLSIAGSVARGGASIARLIVNPSAALKTLFQGKSETTAASMQLRAAQLQLEAAEAALRAKGIAVPGGGGAGLEEAGAVGWLAKGRAALNVGAKAAGIVGLATVAADAAATGLAKTSWYQHLHEASWMKHIPGVQVVHNVAGRGLNIADTVGNLFTGGLWHPHLDKLASANYNPQLAAKWAGVPISQLNKAQRTTLSNYYGSGEKVLSSAQIGVIAAQGKNGSKVLSELTETANKNHAAAAKQITASADISSAALAIKRAADNLDKASAGAASAFQPANVHAAGKAGLQQAVARK